MDFNFDFDDDVPMAGPSHSPARDRWSLDDDDDGPLPPRASTAAHIVPQAAAEETAFTQLTRHWMNERHAPDVLHAQEQLLGRLLDHIKKQVRTCVVPVVRPSARRGASRAGGREGSG